MRVSSRFAPVRFATTGSIFLRLFVQHDGTNIRPRANYVLDRQTGQVFRTAHDCFTACDTALRISHSVARFERRRRHAQGTIVKVCTLCCDESNIDIFNSR